MNIGREFLRTSCQDFRGIHHFRSIDDGYYWSGEPIVSGSGIFFPFQTSYHTIIHISFALASDLRISLVHRKSRFIFQDHLGLRAINQHWPIDYHNICARDFYDALFYGDRRASFRLSIISGLQTSFLERLYLFIP